ncbi:MAG: DUF3135 domain-containing protein [Pseudomonadales bacterium]|nr:DUF3135 domain-containing protein [Pseudomonadales bacterium]
MQELPDFDTLVLMAKNDPEGLETMRTQMSEQIIDAAPEAFKRRLRGLQFQIDAQRRSSSNPISSMNKMYSMMFASFEHLNESLNGANGLNTALQSEPEPYLRAVNDSDMSISPSQKKLAVPIQMSAPHSAEVLIFKR